jgi:alpha-tubulin suppressor-like RCC1 family protein
VTPWPIAVGFATAALLLGCRAPTEITLELTTDIPCGDLDGTAITVGAPGEVESKTEGTVTHSCGETGRIGSLVVVPSGATDAHLDIKVVAGRGYPVESCTPDNDYRPGNAPGKGCVVARRSLPFIPHQPLTLDIELRAVCVGEPCQPGQTCVRGSCVSSTVDPSGCDSDQGCDESTLIPDGGPAPPAVPLWGRGDGICARRTSGEIDCWGGNSLGLLGNDTEVDPSPVQPGMLSVTDIVSLDTGCQASCLVRSDGSVMCAGANETGELGNPGAGPKSLRLVPVDMPPAKQVSVSNPCSEGHRGHACATTREGGDVWCWGDNDGGMSGQPAAAPSVVVPTLVQGITLAKEVSVGPTVSCALTEDGQVWCWGSNGYGELGDPAVQADSSTPVNVQLLGPATRVSVGRTFVSAIVSGKVYTWWTNAIAGNGNGSETPPVAADGIDDAFDLGTGHGVTCVRHGQAPGEILCWGRNDCGQQGDGQGSPSASPVLSPAPGPQINDASLLIVGEEHACALRPGGEVWCWGRNNHGLMSGDGIPSENQSYSPKLVLTL